MESQDTFGDQLSSEIAAEGSSLEMFLQDDEVFEFEQEALNLLDSTKGMRNMVKAMEQDNFLAD